MGSQARVGSKEGIGHLILELQSHVDQVQAYLEDGGALTNEEALGVLNAQRGLIEVRNRSIRRDINNKVPYTSIARQWKMSMARISQLRQHA